MKKIGIVTVACLVAFTFMTPCTVARAEEANCMTKLGNGLMNIFTAVLEIPRHIKDVSQESDPIAGITYGTARGLAFAGARVITGVFDVVTCPFPPFDEPMMERDLSF
jgi:putative exosortase-associated protein (TIGR04073 family)